VRISSSSFLLIFAPDEAAVEIEVVGMVAEKAIHNVSELVSVSILEYSFSALLPSVVDEILVAAE
jgi:hypothetical protein